MVLCNDGSSGAVVAFVRSRFHFSKGRSEKKKKDKKETTKMR